MLCVIVQLDLYKFNLSLGSQHYTLNFNGDPQQIWEKKTDTEKKPNVYMYITFNVQFATSLLSGNFT